MPLFLRRTSDTSNADFIDDFVVSQMSLTSSLDSSWGSVGQEGKKALSEDAKLLSHKQSILDETPNSNAYQFPISSSWLYTIGNVAPSHWPSGLTD